MVNTAWAALVTRIPTSDDLPLTTLVDLIEASGTDVKDRTGLEVAGELSIAERARCRMAAALGRSQPFLKDSAGHDACQAWACGRTEHAEQVYRRHAQDVLTEISSDLWAYLRSHPRRPPTQGEPLTP